MSRRSAAALLFLLASGAAAQHEMRAHHPEWSPGQPIRVHDRIRTYDVRRVRLDLSFEFRTVSGAATLRLAPLEDGLEKAAFDAVDFEVREATVDGTAASWRVDGERVLVALGRPRRAGEDLTVTIAYTARPAEGLFFDERPAPDGTILRTIHPKGEPERQERAWRWRTRRRPCST